MISTKESEMIRNDVYDQVDESRGQFLVIGKVIGMACGRGGLVFFVGTEAGEVCLHPGFHHRPVSLPPSCPDELYLPEVLFHDRWRPVEVAIGTVVHAVCEPTTRLPHAVRWCTQAEYDVCRREVNEINTEKKRVEQEQLERELKLLKAKASAPPPRKRAKGSTKVLVAA